jgi:threonine synthase
VGYHRGALEDVTSRLANPPVDLPADLNAVREALSDL